MGHLLSVSPIERGRHEPSRHLLAAQCRPAIFARPTRSIGRRDPCLPSCPPESDMSWIDGDTSIQSAASSAGCKAQKEVFPLPIENPESFRRPRGRANSPSPCTTSNRRDLCAAERHKRQHKPHTAQLCSAAL